MSQADKIAEMVQKLADDAKAERLRDILTELRDSLKSGPAQGEANTWVGGMTAAIEALESNY